MARKLRSCVKFFPSQRKVVLLTFMEDVGTITVADGRVTLDKSDRRIFRSISHTIIPPGAGSPPGVSGLMVVGEYTNRAGRFEDDADEEVIIPTAQLQTTITNDPPGPPTPILYDIDETVENP